jgi:gas vesicle protein
MELTPEQTTLIGTLAGALVGSLSTLLITVIDKKSDERRHRRELIVRAAVESWKQSVETVISAGRGKIYGFDVYIIHMLRVSELLDGKKLTSDNVVRLMKETDEVTRKVIEYKDGLSKSEPVKPTP